SQDTQGRRIQAADIPILLPGPRRGGIEIPQTGGGPVRHAGRLGGDGAFPDTTIHPLRRYTSDRRAQYAELQPAARGWPFEQTGAFEEGTCRYDRRDPARSGIRYVGRQPRRDNLRTRHPHVRDIPQKHAGYFGDPGYQEALTSSGDS